MYMEVAFRLQNIGPITLACKRAFNDFKFM